MHENIIEQIQRVSTDTLRIINIIKELDELTELNYKERDFYVGPANLSNLSTECFKSLKEFLLETLYCQQHELEERLSYLVPMGGNK